MHNVTYGLLCKHLLAKGVDSKIIIKHRFALGFIAKAAREMPFRASSQTKDFSMDFVNGDRSLGFSFDRLSNTAYMHQFDGTAYNAHGRPTETRINELFAWLYPPAPKAWYVRAWEWVKEKLRW